MTKSEAHDKFLKLIEEHPADLWTITGGDKPDSKMYCGTLCRIGGEKEHVFIIHYRGEVDNDKG